jgi:Domain of unknown function (DUF4276)
VLSTCSNKKNAPDVIIALSDVYTGSSDFKDATDAKAKMQSWVGSEPKFHPHVALHDFEAWLIPYWSSIQVLAQHNKNSPGSNPETINHNKPPSYHIAELFEAGKGGRSYIKTRDVTRILKDTDLMVAIKQCPELKAFINTILVCCKTEPIS